MRAAGGWLPPELAHWAAGTERLELRGLEIERPVFTPAGLRGLCGALRERAHTVLSRRPVAEIVEVLDAAAACWLDPEHAPRRAALALLPALTGFSPEMVAESIRLEMCSSRAPDLWGVLQSELGDPAALDGFVPSPHGRGRSVRALGPALMGVVFSSNIPALPHLSVMRALLLKSSVVGRSASAEPVFLPLYLQTLHGLDPELAGCCAAVSWSRTSPPASAGPAASDAGGPDRSDGGALAPALESALLESIDGFVGWGGVAAEHHFRAAVPAGVPMVFHGHRLGFAWISAAALAGDRDALGDALARDVGVFDQHACLSPQAVFVEGDQDAADALAGSLAAGLDRLDRRLPPRSPEPGRSAHRSQRLLVAEMDQAMRGGRVLRGPGDRWVVVAGSAESLPASPLDRWVQVVPVADTAALLDRLRPLRGRLQNAAVADDSRAGRRLREDLARLGLSRICPPGGMACPSMLWHHDGQACVGAFVRWCDEERVAPGEGGRAGGR